MSGSTRKVVSVGRVMRAVCHAMARRRLTASAASLADTWTPASALTRVQLGSTPPSPRRRHAVSRVHSRVGPAVMALLVRRVPRVTLRGSCSSPNVFCAVTTKYALTLAAVSATSPPVRPSTNCFSHHRHHRHHHRRQI